MSLIRFALFHFLIPTSSFYVSLALLQLHLVGLSLDTTAFSLRDPIFALLIVRIMQPKQLRLIAEYDD